MNKYLKVGIICLAIGGILAGCVAEESTKTEEKSVKSESTSFGGSNRTNARTRIENEADSIDFGNEGSVVEAIGRPTSCGIGI